MLRLALPGWIQPRVSGFVPGETPAVMLNQLTGGPIRRAGALQAVVLLLGGAGLRAVGNCSRGGGEALQERLCFPGGLYQRDDLDHL